MNRRNFLKSIDKICAVLPFVGSSSAVGDSGASEGQPEWIEESFRRQSICRPKPTGATEGKSGCSWKGKLKCGGQNGTLCLRCSYGVKRSGTRPATEEEIKEFNRQAQAECERLYKIERLRIEAAEKATNPPVVINPNATNEYQWHRHNDCEWHCKHRNLPMEFVTRDEYDLFTGKMI